MDHDLGLERSFCLNRCHGRCLENETLLDSGSREEIEPGVHLGGGGGARTGCRADLDRWWGCWDWVDGRRGFDPAAATDEYRPQDQWTARDDEMRNALEKVYWGASKDLGVV